MMMMMMMYSLMSSVDILGTNCDQYLNMVRCCPTSTETARLTRTATSTFTQFLNSGRNMASNTYIH